MCWFWQRDRGRNFLPTRVVIGFAYPLVGALIAGRHPRNPIGWMFGVIGVTQAALEFAMEYATYGLITRPGTVPGGSLMAWFGDWLWFHGFALILTFFKKHDRRRR